MRETYEVFALRYASMTRVASENFIGGDPHETASRLDFFLWLARSEARTVVIDCGFDARSAKKRGRPLERTPAEALALMGVDAAAVETLIITHLHFDHAGGLSAFPAAMIHLQDREMAFAAGRHMTTPVLQKPYELEDVVDMLRRVYAGRVTFHDGDADLFPGLSVHRIGGHSDGIMCVRLWTAKGWLVLASDAAHFYENMEAGRPMPIVYNIGDMVEGWRRLKELASAPELVVPGHDPLVLDRFPPARPDLAGVVARLA